MGTASGSIMSHMGIVSIKGKGWCLQVLNVLDW